MRPRGSRRRQRRPGCRSAAAPPPSGGQASSGRPASAACTGSSRAASAGRAAPRAPSQSTAPSRVNGPDQSRRSAATWPRQPSRCAEVAGDAADIAALAAGHLEDGGVAVGRLDELQPRDGAAAGPRARAPRRRGRGRRRGAPSTLTAETCGGTCRISPVNAGSAARIAAASGRSVGGGDHRALGVVGGGGGAPAHGEAVGLAARRRRRGRSWSPRRRRWRAGRSRPGRACRRARPCGASSARRALATTAAEVGPAGLSTISQPCTGRPRARRAIRLSPRGRAGPPASAAARGCGPSGRSGCRRWKASSGEKRRSMRSVTSRRSLGPVAAERAHHLGGVDPAERQHEGGRVAQVGRDPHLGDRHRDMREVGVVHVAAGEDLGERAPDHLADAQLALARGAARRGVLSLPCRSHPIAVAAESRAAGEDAMAERGRDRGRRRSRPHGPDAGAGGRRDAGRRG